LYFNEILKKKKREREKCLFLPYTVRFKIGSSHHKLNLQAEVQYTHPVPNESQFHQLVMDSEHPDLAFPPTASS
jgi:hypothetical protein